MRLIKVETTNGARVINPDHIVEIGDAGERGRCALFLSDGRGLTVKMEREEFLSRLMTSTSALYL
jgi:hypothetical protein